MSLNKTPLPIYKVIKGQVKELSENEISVIPKSGFEVNFDNLNVNELQEILIRQEKILSNEKFLLKLPDKGKRLKAKYLECKEALNHASTKSKLRENGNKLHSQDSNSYEWDGKYGETSRNFKATNALIESNDKEDNPLLLLARHSVDVPPRLACSSTVIEDTSLNIVEELRQLDIEESNYLKKHGATDVKIPTSRLLMQSNARRDHKPPFKAHRPLKEINRPENKPSSLDYSTLVKTIPIADSFQMTHQVEKKNEGAKNSIISDDTSFQRYRDCNDVHHFLSDSEED